VFFETANIYENLTCGFPSSKLTSGFIICQSNAVLSEWLMAGIMSEALFGSWAQSYCHFGVDIEKLFGL
jgi:hypothetical protein